MERDLILKKNKKKEIKRNKNISQQIKHQECVNKRNNYKNEIHENRYSNENNWNVINKMIKMREIRIVEEEKWMKSFSIKKQCT